MKCKSCGEIVVKGKMSGTEGLNFSFDDDKERQALWGLLKWKRNTVVSGNLVIYRCNHCKCLWVPFGRHLT